MNQQTNAKQENALMRSTLFVFFVSGASSVLMGNLMPFLREAYDISYAQAGLLLAMILISVRMKGIDEEG